MSEQTTTFQVHLQRVGPHGGWADCDYSGNGQRGGFGANFPLRVLDRGVSTMRSVNHPIRGQEVSDRVRKWAAKNAYTLIFLSSMFVITWIVTVTVHYAG